MLRKDEMAELRNGVWYGSSGLPLSATVTNPGILGDKPTAVLVPTSSNSGFVAQTTASPVLSGTSSYVNPIETIQTLQGTAVPVISSSGLSAVAVETIKEKIQPEVKTTAPVVSYSEAAKATEAYLNAMSNQKEEKTSTQTSTTNYVVPLLLGIAAFTLLRK